MAKMTLIGLYNYDDSLFDGLTFPDGINKDIAVNEILMRSGEFEVLYSNLEFNKYQIGKWGEKHYRTFEKWIRALNIEYEPLENYDRMEEWTDTNTGTQTTDSTGTQTVENTGTQTTTNTGTQTTTNTGTQTTTDTGTQTTTNTGTQTTTDTGTQTTTNTGTQTEVGSGSETNVKSGSDTNVKSGSEKDEADNGNTTETQVAAYDSATYANKEKTIFDTDQTNEHTYQDVTDTRTYNDVTDTHTLNDLTNERTDDLTQERTDDLTQERTDDLTQERTDDLTQERTDDLTAERTDDLTAERTDDLTNKRTDDLTGHHVGRTHGNIGVTTSMQLLRDELEVQRFNIYENIADLFIDEFCILVY